MSDDKVTVWNGQLKLGRSPAAGELLVGNSGDFKLTTLTEGSGVTITNSSGAITISASGSGGTVTDVTGTAPITSTGGSTPDISLTVPLDVQYGGTGLSALTAGNVLIGDGTSDVSLVPPGTSGNVLTSDGVTWSSSVPEKGIGSGQTWQNVAGSRVSNVVYTNSTSQPIMVMIEISSGSMAITVDLALIAAPQAANGNTITALSFIVPIGSTYKVVGSGITKWHELRS